VQSHDEPRELSLSVRLTKLTSQPDDVPPLLLLKSAAPHAGKDLDAMRATANALKERSLELFKETLKEYQGRQFFCARHMSNAKLCRIATRSSHPLTPLGPVRQSPRAKSAACTRAVLVSRAVVDCAGGWTDTAGCGGEVSHTASALGCYSDVHRDAYSCRLSQMILDQVFHGVLNESQGTLEVYDEPQDDVS
jgi:26S proteasome regulatory subunit N6